MAAWKKKVSGGKFIRVFFPQHNEHLRDPNIKFCPFCGTPCCKGIKSCDHWDYVRGEFAFRLGKKDE